MTRTDCARGGHSTRYRKALTFVNDVNIAWRCDGIASSNPSVYPVCLAGHFLQFQPCLLSKMFIVNYWYNIRCCRCKILVCVYSCIAVKLNSTGNTILINLFYIRNYPMKSTKGGHTRHHYKTLKKQHLIKSYKSAGEHIDTSERGREAARAAWEGDKHTLCVVCVILCMRACVCVSVMRHG